jgi:hypothetical protein
MQTTRETHMITARRHLIERQLDGVLYSMNIVENEMRYRPEYGGPTTRQEREDMEREARELRREAHALEAELEALS